MRLYSQVRPNWLNGIFYAIVLVSLPAIELYLVGRFFVWPLFAETTGLIFFLVFGLLSSLLAPTAVCYYIISKNKEVNPSLTGDMALFGRLGLIILSPFVLQFQFARFLWARFKFHMFPHPIHQLAQTRTHFALYLRSFIDDDISAKETVESFGDNPIRYARSLATKLTVQDRVEKILGDRLRPHIPVLCIGRPGERYPISSFGRLFVEDASWKEVVRALIEMSQLVIARVGATPGFQWELEILCKQEMMQKTVLVFCTKFGFPFSPREVREAMAALHIDISDVAIR